MCTVCNQSKATESLSNCLYWFGSIATSTLSSPTGHLKFTLEHVTSALTSHAPLSFQMVHPSVRIINTENSVFNNTAGSRACRSRSSSAETQSQSIYHKYGSVRVVSVTFPLFMRATVLTTARYWEFTGAGARERERKGTCTHRICISKTSVLFHIYS